MSYKYYVRKDYKELGYITGVAKCQAEVEQNSEIFEECSVLNDDIINEINNGKIYNLKDGKLIKIDKSKISSLNIKIDDTPIEVDMLIELINCLNGQNIKLTDKLINYAKGGD